MPAYIKTLKNTDGDIIYPQTKASAVFTNDGVNIESIFENPALIGGVFVPAEAKIVTLKDKDGEIIAPRTTTEAISDFPSVDTTPTYGSNNIVTSGGVAASLAERALAGFGYGDAPIVIRASSDNESYEAYCAKVDAVLSTMGEDGVKQVFAYPPQVYGSGGYVATLYKLNINGLYASLTTTTTYSGPDRTLGFTMRKLNGVWEPLEWINPPMLAGVEYRTTERYMGRPVYTQCVNMGAASDGLTVTTNVSGILGVIRYAATIAGNAMPLIYNKNLSDDWSAYVLVSKRSSTSFDTKLYCGTSIINNNVTCQVWYTI